MRIRYLSSLLLVAVLIALAGCTSAPAPSPTAAQPASSATSAAPAANTNPAVKLSGTIVLGTVLSLTGPVANSAGSMRKAMELAVDEINASGLLGDAKIRMVFEDDANKPDQGVTAANKLISQDKAVAILGPLMSAVTASVAPVANTQKVPLITVSTTTGLEGKEDYVFNVSDYNTAYRSLGERTLKKFGYKKPVLIEDVSNPAYIAFRRQVEAAYKEAGLTFAARETITGKDTDFSSVLTKLEAVNPDAIVLGGNPTQVASILLQAKERGGVWTKIPFMATTANNVWYEVAGKQAVGVITTALWSEQGNDASKKYASAYRAKYGAASLPVPNDAVAYQAVYWVATGLKNAGTTTDREALTAALKKLNKFDLLIPGWTMNETGEATFPGATVALNDKGTWDILQ